MGEFKKVYSTKAENVGGRQGKSRLADGSYEVDIAMPEEIGGDGQGQNPEQLFALAYAACFNSALEGVKEAGGYADHPAKVNVVIDLLKEEDRPVFKLAGHIEVAIEDLDLETVQKLADKTHHACPYSLATQGNLDIDVQAVDFE